MEKERLIEILIDNCNIPERGCVLYENQFEKVAIEIFEALIWHRPDVVPPKGEWKGESIEVLNQSDEIVFYDFKDKEWYNYDIQGRIAHVEKWRYPEPEPIKK